MFELGGRLVWICQNRETDVPFFAEAELDFAACWLGEGELAGRGVVGGHADGPGVKGWYG